MGERMPCSNTAALRRHEQKEDVLFRRGEHHDELVALAKDEFDDQPETLMERLCEDDMVEMLMDINSTANSKTLPDAMKVMKILNVFWAKKEREAVLKADKDLADELEAEWENRL